MRHARAREAPRPGFATVKIGFELYAEAGPVAFEALHADGFAVFADLKLHDIPNTVARVRHASSAAAAWRC